MNTDGVVHSQDPEIWFCTNCNLEWEFGEDTREGYSTKRIRAMEIVAACTTGGLLMGSMATYWLSGGGDLGGLAAFMLGGPIGSFLANRFACSVYFPQNQLNSYIPSTFITTEQLLEFIGVYPNPKSLDFDNYKTLMKNAISTHNQRKSPIAVGVSLIHLIMKSKQGMGEPTKENYEETLLTVYSQTNTQPFPFFEDLSSHKISNYLQQAVNTYFEKKEIEPIIRAARPKDIIVLDIRNELQLALFVEVNDKVLLYCPQANTESMFLMTKQTTLQLINNITVHLRSPVPTIYWPRAPQSLASS
ncbi:hypothetical protein [Endozoicomonas sp. Mp262]|uniref:hypothetical protein n=1 Tax=Endozoicomonas sp. Mp262 TaxID=2919499 RepID=UPI0021D977E2